MRGAPCTVCVVSVPGVHATHAGTQHWATSAPNTHTRKTPTHATHLPPFSTIFRRATSSFMAPFAAGRFPDKLFPHVGLASPALGATHTKNRNVVAAFAPRGLIRCLRNRQHTTQRSRWRVHTHTPCGVRSSLLQLEAARTGSKALKGVGGLGHFRHVRRHGSKPAVYFT